MAAGPGEGRPIDVAPRRVGRPRDPQLDARVLAAVRRSLVANGWSGTSVRGVAERSGVSRPAIMRRWPSKAHLVFEALLGTEPDLAPFVAAGPEGWTEALIAQTFELFDRPETRSAVPGLLGELTEHEDLRAELWEGFSGPAAALAADAASDPGPDADAALQARAAIVVAAGAALFATTIAGDDERLRAEVQSVLCRAIAPQSAAPPPDQASGSDASAG